MLPNKIKLIYNCLKEYLLKDILIVVVVVAEVVVLMLIMMKIFKDNENR